MNLNCILKKEVVLVILFILTFKLCLAETLIVDANNIGGNISDLLYGTCIYWSGSPNGLSNYANTQEKYNIEMQKWEQTLEIVKELGPTVLRIGGGLAGNRVKFEMIHGLVETRELSPSGYVLIMGIDESLQTAEKIGAVPMVQIGPNAYAEILTYPPYFTFNHDIAARKFADMVEYINAPNDGSNWGVAHEPCPYGHPCRNDPSFIPILNVYNKDWAAVRAANGRHEPYNVTYWEFGNELYSSSVDDYISAMKIIVPKMREVDPGIHIGAVAYDSNNVLNAKLIEWNGKIFDETNHLFDFWIRHEHVEMCTEVTPKYYENKEISMQINVPTHGDYVFSFLVGELYRQFEVYIDDVRIDSINTGFFLIPRYQSTAPAVLTPGNKTLTIKITNHGNPGYYFSLNTIVIMKEINTGWAQWIDLKDSKEIYYTTQNALPRISTYNYSRPYLPYVDGQECDPSESWCELWGGKPVYITEWSAGYGGSYTQPMKLMSDDFREMIVTADILNKYVKNNIPIATHWEIFNELERRGALEGIAPDHRGRTENTVSGVYEDWHEIGRPNEKNPSPPNKRPIFHLFRLYTDNIRGKWIDVKIEDRGFFTIGRDALGFVCTNHDFTDADVYYIDSIASVNEQNLTILIINRNLEEDIDIDINLQNFDFKNNAKLYMLSAERPSESNDPEDCLTDIDGDIYAECIPSCYFGDCVGIDESDISVSESFTYRAPKLSVSFIVIESLDFAQKPPQTTGIITLQDMLNSYGQYQRGEVSIEFFLERFFRWVVYG